jgi:hypothetical protein
MPIAEIALVFWTCLGISAFVGVGFMVFRLGGKRGQSIRSIPESRLWAGISAFLVLPYLALMFSAVLTRKENPQLLSCLNDFSCQSIARDGANLPGTNLRHTDLSGRSMRIANLRGADLAYADLTGSNLTGANLSGASLIGANLTNTNLTGADLTEANLSNANLQDSKLSDATLSGANLTHASLARAEGLRNL